MDFRTQANNSLTKTKVKAVAHLGTRKGFLPQRCETMIVSDEQAYYD